MATGEEGEEGGQWEVKFREDEELEFYTELALHETERWISAVTKKSFAFPEDPRKSLENGILLCELLNNIKPGSVKRINKLPTPIAGLDNLNVFLRACREHFGLNDTQLFDPSDLEDLSQRAIAESEHLKEELDRRLRNVAICVYWIGRIAAHSYQGPKIDQSAFAALVHNQHRHRDYIVSDGQLRRDSSCSWETNSHSSAYGSPEGGRRSGSSVREPIDPGPAPRHVRDGSYDSYASYGKGSEESLDELVFEVDENGMPIPRYSSSSALNQGQEGSRGGSERDSSMYSSDKNSGLYRSSPDLTHSSLSNRRCSSTDSTDGSHGGGHSRQSSDSIDYPTRRYSTQSSSSRKTSVSTDPLQFIKVKGATDLASTAEEQIKLSAETKKMKITESISEDDSSDWQSNLAVWKNRRKSHSEKSYQMKEELEQMEREKEEPRVASTQSTKTFSQMQEERERRKSAGLKHFYPIEDEGEDDIFSPPSSEVKHSSPASRSSSRFQSSMTPKEDVKDTKVRSRTKEDVPKWAQDSASEEEEEGGRRKETVSNSYKTITETRTSRFSKDMENNTSPESRASRFSRDMDNNMSTTESRASRFSRDMDNNTSTTESRASRFSRDMENNPSTTESRGSRFSRDVENSALTSESRASRFSHDTENNAPRQRRSGLPDYRTQEKDSWQKQPAEVGRDGALKENNRSSARSSGKVSNILKNFQQKEEEEAKIKPSVNSSVSAGRKSFEHIVGRSSENSASVSHSVGDSYRAWSTDKGSGKSSSRTEMTSHSSSAVYSSNRNSGKDYVEKTIKISQKPNSDKGFGFMLSGGADKKQPVVVEKVGLGSAADVCELQAKDEVVTINGQSVARLTSVELTHKVEDAVRTGQIELRVKRFLGSADDMEDEEDFLSTDEDVDTPDRSISKSSSIRAENSFDSLDSRDGQQKTEDEPERPWMEEHNRPMVKVQSNRRGDPTSTSSDSGYDAQTFSPYHRGDNSSNEEELAPSQQQQPESQTRPSLAARTRHLYPRDEDEDDYVNLRVTESTTTSYQHQHSDRGMGKEVAPSGDVHVESRPTITVRRQRMEVLQNRAEEDNSKPAASSETRSAVTASRREERHSEQTASEDSDSGPPAALRKWQRQRPRAEYTFESDDQPPKFYDQMKMSPRHPDKPDEAPQEDTHNRSSEDTDDTLNSAMPAVSSRRAFRGGEDRQRIRTWNQKQEEERQPDEALPPGHSDAPVHSSPYQQQRVTAERAQIQQQYQEDLQRAANSERQKQQQEKQLLEPELEKMRVLEERRAQRQARLQMYAQNLEADFAPPASSSSSSSSHPAPSPMEPAYDKGGSASGFAAGSLSMQQHTSTFTTQVNGSQGSGGGQPEVLIIDPRNRGDSGREPVEITQQGQPVQFQVKINSRETPQGLLIQPEVIPAHHAAPAPSTDHAAFLEAERERIRQEELQKIEAERLQREEEERKLLREKEEQLRRQEEMLRQQQEELRKTQERLERERQQIQQHMPSAKTQLPDHQSFTNTTHDGLQFETVTSKVRGSSPVYTSTIVAGPRRSEGRPQASQSYPDRNQDGYGVRRSEPSWNSSRPQTASSWRGSVQTVSSSHSQLPKWPPAGEEQHHSATLPAHGMGQYSREDMVAMNRKATPLQAKPPSPSPVSSSASQADAAIPVKREAPSKSQIHSLNSVPRAKFRQSDQWMADEPSYSGDHSGGGEGRPMPDGGRRSEAFRSQFAGPQDHWLVQEAERRRLNESGYGQGPTRAQFSGPIKPATDNYGNRWREGGGEVRLSPNMPAQLRQTLLQKTAGARGTTPSASSQEMNPPGPSPYQGESTASMSQTLPPNFGYGGGYPPSSRSDPQHPTPSHGGGRDNSANISGKQRCSHCNQELGFGAAMVIESLGLYYHTQCFRCCVCRTPLGSGVEGADVRVRVNKLHCPNCYSNDEGTRHMAAY